MRKLFVIMSERCCLNFVALGRLFWKKHITCSLHQQLRLLQLNGEAMDEFFHFHPLSNQWRTLHEILGGGGG